MKREKGKVDEWKDIKGIDLVFLVFPKVKLSQVTPEASKDTANAKASPFQTCPDINMVGKHPDKKRGPTHQLTTEKQIKTVLVMCRY